MVISTMRITGFDFTYGRAAFSAASPTVQLMFGSSTYRITGLHYPYGIATLSADYVGCLYFETHGVTPFNWVSNPKDSLCWLALPRDSLGYTTLMEAPP